MQASEIERKIVGEKIWMNFTILNHFSYITRFIAIIDNAVGFKLRMWIIDPKKESSGESKADIIFAAWKAFKANRIRVFYPPREVVARKKLFTKQFNQHSAS